MEENNSNGEATNEKYQLTERNDWHSWFYAQLNISLFHYLDRITIEREHVLGAEPPRADFLIIENNGVIDLGLDIFRIFRKHNIIELKSPGNGIDSRDLWKVLGYSGFYIGNAPHKGDITHDEVTLSIFQESYPRELFTELAGIVVPDEIKGIYHIEGFSILPIQIIVTRELPGEEYAGYRAISKAPKEEDVLRVINQGRQEMDPFLISQYQAYLDKLAKIDNDYIKSLRRRLPEMGAWMDLFKPEIDEKISESRQNDLFEYVQDGGMSLDFAAKKSNQSVEDFIADMERHGYKVPQMV